MNVNSERKYVIVCNEHPAIFKDALLFWGRLTDDSRKKGLLVDILAKLTSAKDTQGKNLKNLGATLKLNTHSSTNLKTSVIFSKRTKCL